jgi:hypothetical protein
MNESQGYIITFVPLQLAMFYLTIMSLTYEIEACESFLFYAQIFTLAKHLKHSSMCA